MSGALPNRHLHACGNRVCLPACLSDCLSGQAKRKRDRMGDMKIVVAGCVAQQEGEQLLRRVPEVDLVMGEQQHQSQGGGGD